MLKRFSFALSALLCCLLLPLRVAADSPPATKSWAYIVMDADTGQVLVEKNADQKAFPASITKVLTAALALESCAPEETFVMSEEAVFSLEQGATHIALSPGESVSVEQMLYATMLASANDAANGLAEHAGGSISAFVERMNAQARVLGAQDTHFTNANGLHDDNHYTTARDFARITRWALTIPGFREVFVADEYRMSPTNLQPQSRNFGTYNCLTVESAYTYEGACGGKLGWTPEADHTFVAVAERGGMELILVALKSDIKWEKFQDAVALYDYCFSHFQRAEIPALGLPASVPLMDGQNQLVGEVRLSLPDALPVDLPAGVSAALVQLRAQLPDSYRQDAAISPTYGLYLEGEALYTAPLDYALALPEPEAQSALTEAEEKADKGEKGAVAVLLPWIAVAGVLLLLILRQRAVIRRRKRRRQLRDQRLGRASAQAASRVGTAQDSRRRPPARANGAGQGGYRRTSGSGSVRIP